MKIYNDQARKRINAAVRKVERLDVAKDRRRPPVVTPQATFFILQTDIEHDAFGFARRAKGDMMALPKSVDSGTLSEFVYNFGPRAWAGSLVMCERFSLAGAEPGDGVAWGITQAWSATRIAGIATTDITAGGSGTLSSVSGVDGPYPYGTASITLVTSNVSATAGQKIWADLVHTPSGSRWYGYHVDTTTSSTPGGGTQQWQQYNAVTFFRSNGPTVSAGNYGNYFTSSHYSLPVWQETSSLPQAVRYAGGNASLFRQVNTLFATADQGNLEAVVGGDFAFTVRLTFRMSANSNAPVVPAPPLMYTVLAGLDVNGAGTQDLGSYPLMTNPNITQTFEGAQIYWITGAFVLRDVEVNDRLKIWLTPNSIYTDSDLDDWGFKPMGLRLLAQKL